MNKISDVFQSEKKALIAYVTVGYPSVKATSQVVPLLAENGCDIIELGIPFSDPLADGITIQNASHNALQNGITINRCLTIAGKLRKSVSVPLIFMTYYNPVLNYGLEKFCRNCLNAGVTGLIVPDLPPEEGSELETYACRYNIDVIYLLAPNSTAQRIKLVAERSTGFVYLVSLTGVTGTHSTITMDFADFVSRVRQVARQPLCVGFGISTPEQAATVADVADGVIIGSKIIRLMESDSSLKSVREFVKDVRSAMDATELSLSKRTHRKRYSP